MQQNMGTCAILVMLG